MYDEKHGKFNASPFLVVLIGSFLGKSNGYNDLVPVFIESGRGDGELGVSTVTFAVPYSGITHDAVKIS